MLHVLIGEGVIADKKQIRKILEALNVTPVKLNAGGGNARERERVWVAYGTAARAIINAFFEGGEKGAELFNWYKSFKNPLTVKKIEAGLCEFQNYVCFLYFFVMLHMIFFNSELSLNVLKYVNLLHYKNSIQN